MVKKPHAARPQGFGKTPGVLSSLPRAFYDRPTLQVARELLGRRLVRRHQGQRISGTIVETEAYIGERDLACHARAGRTARTAVMYGPPGHAYVYFSYGLHWLFNCVTETEGFPAAVLVRAIVPQEGIDLIQKRRGRQPRRLWTDGPGKICQALGISGEQNGVDLCLPGSPVLIEQGDPIPDSSVTTTPRVGLNTVPEPWKSMPWRFQVQEM